MAIFGKRESNDDHAAAQVAEAADALGTSTSGDGPETEVQRTVPTPIPPLLTDESPTVVTSAVDDDVMIAETVGAMGVAPDPDPVTDPVLPEAPGEAAATAAERAGIVRERAAEHAAAAREKATEHAGAAREKASEHASAAREKLAESAGDAKERLAEGAAEAKIRGAKMRRRLGQAASDARDSASIAAAEARERVANADVNEFAHSTTRLIDSARPFFLAGFGLLFAALGFLEGDSGTAELFVAGSILFVIGAGFSGEINAFISARLHRNEAPRDDAPSPPRHEDN